MRAVLLSAILLVSCGEAQDDPITGERWDLVWEDDFQGDAGAPPNPDYWVAEIGTGQDGWGNGELQYYTDRPENLSLDGDGFLRIIARRESYEGSDWTSARIKTQGLVTTTYGRIEARILLPAGRGLWPAFWMLGSDIETLGWPTCGEIDIMEAKGRVPGESSGAIHGPGYSGSGAHFGTRDFADGESIDSDFHVYRVDWDPEHITWYVDDQLMFTGHPGDVTGPWVLDHDFFMLLNLAVGGVFDGPPDQSTPDVNTMAVDWVRIYERRTPIEDPDVVVD